MLLGTQATATYISVFGVLGNFLIKGRVQQHNKIGQQTWQEVISDGSVACDDIPKWSLFEVV